MESHEHTGSAWGQGSSTSDLVKQAVANLLAGGDVPAATQRLAKTLARSSSFFKSLCNPSEYTKEQAVTLAVQLKRFDPFVDVRLAMELPGRQEVVDGTFDGPTVERILEILDVISPSPRLNLKICPLVHTSNPRISSKVSLYIAKRVQNPDWIENHIAHPDPRVRANIIEALWTVDSPIAKDIYRRALLDRNNRVVGNALLGLYKQSPSLAFEQTIKTSYNSSAAFRATAAWVMGQTEDTRFLVRLAEMTTEPEERVLRVVRRSIELIQAQARKTDRCEEPPSPAEALSGDPPPES